MSDQRRTRLIEARTVIHVLYAITADAVQWGEFIPREEIMHLLKMARQRLDELERLEQTL